MRGKKEGGRCGIVDTGSVEKGVTGQWDVLVYRTDAEVMQRVGAQDEWMRININ